MYWIGTNRKKRKEREKWEKSISLHTLHAYDLSVVILFYGKGSEALGWRVGVVGASGDLNFPLPMCYTQCYKVSPGFHYLRDPTSCPLFRSHLPPPPPPPLNHPLLLHSHDKMDMINVYFLFCRLFKACPYLRPVTHFHMLW